MARAAFTWTSWPYQDSSAVTQLKLHDDELTVICDVARDFQALQVATDSTRWHSGYSVTDRGSTIVAGQSTIRPSCNCVSVSDCKLAKLSKVLFEAGAAHTTGAHAAQTVVRKKQSRMSP